MRRNKALERTVRMIPPLESGVTNVSGEAELLQVSRLDKLAYGGESIDHEGLRAWWRAYPKGIYILWEGPEIVGAVGIWPIRKRTYHSIIRGDLDEADITARDICRSSAGETYAYWYFADIVIREDHQDQPEEWHLILLEEAIKKWSGEGNLAPEVHLCALGFTPAGISLLRTFRFLPAGDPPVHSRQGKPVYQRTVSVEGISQALKHLNDTRKEVRKYDVFISYRRDRASLLAERIHDELEERGLKVFMDRDDLSQGGFDTPLRKALVEARHFIIILSPCSLNKRRTKVDYFREEIALAVEKKKKIIPIVMKGFRYPKKSACPDYILTLPPLNYIDPDDEPDAMIDKIMDFIDSRGRVGA